MLIPSLVRAASARLAKAKVVINTFSFILAMSVIPNFPEGLLKLVELPVDKHPCSKCIL
jgi:hypothetical protein